MRKRHDFSATQYLTASPPLQAIIYPLPIKERVLVEIIAVIH